jgi:predicted ATP-grasp superfamily ATP-dependent carboligase
MQALVTDVHLRSAVAGLRGLGRAGIPAMATGPGRAAPGLFSRYAERRSVVADGGPPGAFVRHLAAAGRSFGAVIVYPGQESTVDALLDESDLPSPLRLPYPRPDSLRVLRDKRALAGLAADVGLGAPATLAEATVEEIGRRPPPFPCVLKPARPGGSLATARLVDGPRQLDDVLRGLPPDEPLLVQERAGGSLAAVAMVVDTEGQVAARFQQAARRTWPPDAGISSLAVSVAPDERLVSRCAALLAAAGFAGLAQLQFLESQRGHSLIDVNPRFYGSLPLALASGVNLPAAWHRMLTGADGAGPGPYRLGVTYRWLEGDLMAASRGAPRLLLDRPGSPRTGAVWAGDDPLPGLVYAGAAAAEIVARRVRSAGRRRRA